MKRPKISYIDGIANCSSKDVKKLEKYIDSIESSKIIFRNWLNKKLIKLEELQDEYLCQGGNDEGYSEQIKLLKNILAVTPK